MFKCSPGCRYRSSGLQNSALGDQHERPHEPPHVTIVMDVTVAVDRDPDRPALHDQNAVDEIDAVRLADKFPRRDVVDHQRTLAGDAEAAETHALAKQSVLALSGQRLAIFRAMDTEQPVVLIVINLGVDRTHDLVTETLVLHVDLRLAGHLDAEAKIVAEEFLPIIRPRR